MIMFQDFIKIIDRSFIVGYLTPVILFITVTLILIDNYFPNTLFCNYGPSVGNISSNSNTINQTILGITNLMVFIDSFWKLSILIFLTFFVSVILIIYNNNLIQILEGYSLLSRTPLLSFRQNKYDEISRKLKDIKLRYIQEKKEKGVVSQVTKNKYMDLLLVSRNRFPPNREEVLPTSFGNIIRAAEIYPREMYGLDAVSVWGRIIELVPKEHRESIRNDKANVDFSVNLFFLMIAAILEYLIFTFITGSFCALWLLASILFLLLLAGDLAEKSARMWGENIKTVFDLYRHDMLAKMGLPEPFNLDEERGYWRDISKSFTYWKKLK